MPAPRVKASKRWFEFLGPATNPSHCGLCGNSGVIDTRGVMFTPAGVECGVLAFCICPNGRLYKTKKYDLEAVAARREGGMRTGTPR